MSGVNAVRLSAFTLSLSKGAWASTSSARTANRTVLCQVFYLSFDNRARVIQGRFNWTKTLHDFDRRSNGRERISQFVPKHGEKFVLAPVGLLQFVFRAFARGNLGNNRTFRTRVR